MEAIRSFAAEDPKYRRKVCDSALFNASVELFGMLKLYGMSEEQVRQIAFITFERFETVLKEAEKDPKAAWEAWLKTQNPPAHK